MSQPGADAPGTLVRLRPVPNCRGGFVRAELKAFLDHELAAPRKLIVQLHLTRCAGCREEIVWLNRLGEDMRDLESARPRPELRARILAALPDASPHGPATRNQQNRAPIRIAWATAACVAAAAAAFALTRPPDPAIPKAAPDVAMAAPRPAPEVAVAVHPAAPEPLTADEKAFEQRVEELYNRRMAEVNHQEEQRDLDTWHRLLNAAVVSQHQNADHIAPAEVRLAVYVPSVDGVRQQLETWANSHGALAPVRKDATEEERETIAMQVAPEKGAELLGFLRRSGDVADTSPAKSSHTGETPAVQPVVPSAPAGVNGADRSASPAGPALSTPHETALHAAPTAGVHPAQTHFTAAQAAHIVNVFVTLRPQSSLLRSGG